MPQKPLPVVRDHLLHLPESQAGEHAPAVVGSQRWYTWLAEEEHRSFSLRNALGTFTARRERKRHGWYWYLYRKSAGKLRKAYLGKAEEISLERLNLIAATLVTQQSSVHETQGEPQRSGEHGQPDHPEPTSDSKHPSLVASASEPPLRNLPPLPVPLTALIGREAEVAAVCAHLRRTQVRFLVLTGPGGIGKTRLALQAATELQQDFSAGVCFVSLESLRDPTLVASTISTTLGLRETARTPMLDQLKNALRSQHLLLLLDNFEQVALAAPLLTELLAACPHLKVLVSSRAQLHVRGEYEYVVPPLALPDPRQLLDSGALAQYASVALFLQSAWALQPDFQINSTSTRTIAQICIHLEGVPLAIELAAARIKQLPPQALLSHLSQRLPLLTSGPQDAPVRQQTLHNTLAWSYALLSAWEQWLLRSLSVFTGSCTLQAAEAVCSMPNHAVSGERTSVLDGLASLIDKSLLYQTQREGEEPRFAMLEMTREYGQEMLARCEETAGIRQAHARYYLGLVEQAAQAWEGPQHAVWLGQLEQDHDNLRTAMQWTLEQEGDESCLEAAFRFGAALCGFWQVRGYFREGRTFLHRLLAQSEGSLPSRRIRALNDAVLLAISQYDHDGAEALCQENLLRCRELGDRLAMVRVLYLLGWIACLKGNLATAHARLSESLALSQEIGDQGGMLIALTWLGVVTTYQGEYAGAHMVLEQALTMQRKLGNKRGMGWPLLLQAWGLILSRRDLMTAQTWLTEANGLFRELGDKWGLADCRRLSGLLTLERGDATRARTLLEQSATLYQEIGNRRGRANALSLLGKVAVVQQDRARARALYKESLQEAMAVDGPFEIASALEGLAGVVAAERGVVADVLWAAQLWGAAAVLREKMGAPIPPIDRTANEESMVLARNAIGRRIFSAYWAQGRTMTPEQAFAAQGKVTGRTLGAEALSTRNSSPKPAGLTARETEVLAWVARGLSDAQVAEQLVISPRTVTSHLSSIYNKLGVTSRAAATRFALEHQLA